MQDNNNVNITLHGNCILPTEDEIANEIKRFGNLICRNCMHARRHLTKGYVMSCTTPPQGQDEFTAIPHAISYEQCPNYKTRDRPGDTDARKKRIRAGLQRAESLKGKRLPPAPESPVKSL